MDTKPTSYKLHNNINYYFGGTMKIVKEALLTGERAEYNKHDICYIDTTFDDGESPLKECSDIELHNCIFKWKYPLWYSKNIKVYNTTWLDTARSGVWYTKNIYVKDSIIAAPKQFRRCENVTLENVSIPNAFEFLWTAKDVKLKSVSASGDYFLMNSENVEIEDFKLNGNYCFDGAKHIRIKNAILNSKDSFWNSEDVEVINSTIIGEYIGWNSKNITFINCVIDSEQGMCYIDNIKMINCKLLNTNLCFELCKDVDAIIDSNIVSVKNPISGKIIANSIGEIILDKDMIDPSKTIIETKE